MFFYLIGIIASLVLNMGGISNSGSIAVKRSHCEIHGPLQ